MMSENFKPRVIFDLDGVIHSYIHGWQGEDVINDPVVPGVKELIDELRNSNYLVGVVSTRCATEKGLAAVRKYLDDNNIVVDSITKEKLPAVVYIDDRAICFTGTTDGMLEKIKNFKPWYA